MTRSHAKWHGSRPNLSLPLVGHCPLACQLAFEQLHPNVHSLPQSSFTSCLNLLHYGAVVNSPLFNLLWCCELSTFLSSRVLLTLHLLAYVLHSYYFFFEFPCSAVEIEVWKPSFWKRWVWRDSVCGLGWRGRFWILFEMYCLPHTMLWITHLDSWKWYQIHKKNQTECVKLTQCKSLQLYHYIRHTSYNADTST